MQRHLCRFLLINSLLSLFAFSFPAKGQDNIIAGLDTTGKTVLVKWFDNTVIFPYGVHIYRQESENIWERMTAKPFRKGDYPVPGHVLQEDSLMSAFIDMVRDARPSDLEGIAGAMVIVKAVENNDFARYLGICYYDENVVSGKRYRYRVMRLNAQGRETLLAESPFVEVGVYTPIAPPVGLDIKSGDSKVDIKWAPEPLRYFAVNIYRSSDRDPVPRKINPEPMMISERTDNTGKEGYPEIFFTDEPLSKKKVRYESFFPIQTFSIVSLYTLPYTQTSRTRSSIIRSTAPSLPCKARCMPNPFCWTCRNEPHAPFCAPSPLRKQHEARWRRKAIFSGTMCASGSIRMFFPFPAIRKTFTAMNAAS